MVALRIRDIMTTDVRTVTPGTPVHEALRTMADLGIGGLPVVDDDGALVGIVTELDVLEGLRGHVTGLDTTVLPSPFDLLEIPFRAALQRMEVSSFTDRVEEELVEDVMTSNVVTIRVARELEDAAARMAEHRINRLPVVDDDGGLVGIVTRGDLLRALARRSDASPSEADLRSGRGPAPGEPGT